MKNTMRDVRNHLVAMLEALSDDEADDKTIARAKAAADVAGRYTESVKCEVDARRLLADCSIAELPPVLEIATPQKLHAIGRSA